MENRGLYLKKVPFIQFSVLAGAYYSSAKVPGKVPHLFLFLFGGSVPFRGMRHWRKYHFCFLFFGGSVPSRGRSHWGKYYFFLIFLVGAYHFGAWATEKVPFLYKFFVRDYGSGSWATGENVFFFLFFWEKRTITGRGSLEKWHIFIFLVWIGDYSSGTWASEESAISFYFFGRSLPSWGKWHWRNCPVFYCVLVGDRYTCGLMNTKWSWL